MRFQPHPYQRYCIQRIIADPAVGLFLDMGLGENGDYPDRHQRSEI